MIAVQRDDSRYTAILGGGEEIFAGDEMTD